MWKTCQHMHDCRHRSHPGLYRIPDCPCSTCILPSRSPSCQRQSHTRLCSGRWHNLGIVTRRGPCRGNPDSIQSMLTILRNYEYKRYLSQVDVFGWDVFYCAGCIKGIFDSCNGFNRVLEASDPTRAFLESTYSGESVKVTGPEGAQTCYP